MSHTTIYLKEILPIPRHFVTLKELWCFVELVLPSCKNFLVLYGKKLGLVLEFVGWPLYVVCKLSHFPSKIVYSCIILHMNNIGHVVGRILKVVQLLIHLIHVLGEIHISPIFFCDLIMLSMLLYMWILGLVKPSSISLGNSFSIHVVNLDQSNCSNQIVF